MVEVKKPTPVLELSRAATPAFSSPREQTPFALTPLIPYLSYFKAPLEQTASSQNSN